MKKLSIIFALVFLNILLFAQSNTEKAKEVLQTVEMLNYVSTLSQRIKIAKTDRLELCNIRDEIYNNTIISGMDSDTQQQLINFEDNIVKYTLITKQRERLDYIAEQEKAQAIKAAIPNPIYILSFVDAKDPVGSIVSLVGMATSSVINYSSEKNAVELNYLKENWKLDDEEYQEFENQSKEVFNHMVNVARHAKIPDERILREEAIIKFAELEEDLNLQRRINDLENGVNSRLYLNANYGPYYLLLSDSYYERAKEFIKENPASKLDKDLLQKYYEKCILWFEKYINRDIKIFKKDFELVKLLPKIIYAARQIYNDKNYEIFAEKCLKIIEAQTFEKNWEVRYFAALTYIQLAELNKNKQKNYYEEASKLLFTNISYLSKKQEQMLIKYVMPINETIPAGTTSKDKKIIKAMIEQEKKLRKTTLPPMNDALLLNSELLYWLKSEHLETKNSWNINFVKPTNDAFWNYQIRTKYNLPTTINDEKSTTGFNRKLHYKLDFNDSSCNEIKIPVVFLSENMTIKIKAEKNNSDTKVVSGKPVITAIIRPKEISNCDIKAANEYLLDTIAVLDVSSFTKGLSFKNFNKVTFSFTSYDKTLSRSYKKKSIDTVKNLLNYVPFINYNEFELVN